MEQCRNLEDVALQTWRHLRTLARVPLVQVVATAHLIRTPLKRSTGCTCGEPVRQTHLEPINRWLRAVGELSPTEPLLWPPYKNLARNPRRRWSLSWSWRRSRRTRRINLLLRCLLSAFLHDLCPFGWQNMRKTFQVLPKAFHSVDFLDLIEILQHTNVNR